jgi:hypothetical protein
MSGYKVAAPKFIKGAAGRRYVQVDGDLEGNLVEDLARVKKSHPA